MKPIIILGTGGNCIDILDTINEVNLSNGNAVYECVGFLDDDREKWEKKLFGVKVLGSLDSAAGYPDCGFVNGIGSPENFWRKPEIIGKTGVPPERFETIVHPTASVSKMARLGRGVVVLQNATIASNAVVGDHVIVLPNSIISHDSTVGDYTCVAGGVCVSGGVAIGGSCYLGTNSSVIGNISIGEGSLIGMGSVVVEAVEKNSVVAGNPARFVRKVVADR